MNQVFYELYFGIAQNWNHSYSSPVPHSRHRLGVVDLLQFAIHQNCKTTCPKVENVISSITLILICITLSLITLLGNNLQEKCHFYELYFGIAQNQNYSYSDKFIQLVHNRETQWIYSWSLHIKLTINSFVIVHWSNIKETSTCDSI